MGGEGRDLVIEFTLADLRTLFGLMLPIAGMIYTWVATRQKDVETRFADINRRFGEGSERMDRLDSRLSRTEQTVQGLPSRNDIHAIELHMERQAGSLARMEAVIEGTSKVMERLETIVTRYEDHLLKKGNS